MKLPPYSKPLHNLLSSGQKPNNSVYCFIGGESWEYGKCFSISYPTRVIALPPNHSPYMYQWPVEGCEILLHETTPLVTDYIEEIVKVLFAYDADRVVLSSVDFLTTIYKKDF